MSMNSKQDSTLKLAVGFVLTIIAGAILLWLPLLMGR